MMWQKSGRSRFAVVVFFCLFSLFQLGRIQLGRVAFYVYEPVMLFLLSVMFLKARNVSRLIQKYPVSALFVGWTIGSYFFRFYLYDLDVNIIAALYLFRLIGTLCFGGFFVELSRESPGFKRLLTSITIYLTIWTLITGFAQYFLYPDLRNIAYLGWDPHLYRLAGLFFEPAIAGSALGLFALYFITAEASRSRHILAFVSIVGIMLTYSRGTYLGFIVSGLYIIASIGFGRLKSQISVRPKLFFATFSFVVLAVFFFLYAGPKEGEGVRLTRTSTIVSRFVDYELGAALFLRHPIAGVGYNRIFAERDSRASSEYADHGASGFQSGFLTIAASLGLIGLLLWLGVLREFSRGSLFGAVSVLFLSVSSLTDNIFLHPFVLVIWFLFLASSDYSPPRKKPHDVSLFTDSGYSLWRISAPRGKLTERIPGRR